MSLENQIPAGNPEAGSSGTAVPAQQPVPRDFTGRDGKRFFEMSLDLICIAGTDGYFKKLNPAWERTLGFSEAELLARPFVELVHPDDREATLAEVRKMDGGAKVVQFENRYRHKDGSYRWLTWMAPAIEPGEATMYATARDVTGRKEQEAAHAALLQRLELATRSARIGVWDWDITRDELAWDDRMYKLYGVREEDFGGAYEAWLKGVHPGDRSFCDAAIRQALSGEKEYDIDFRVCWPDGTQRVIKGNGQVIRDASGKAVRMTGINYDITDQKRAGQRVALQLAVSKVLAESGTLVEATPLLVRAMAEALEARAGAIWEVDAAQNVLRCINIWHRPGDELADFERTTRAITFAPGVGMPGRVWQSGHPVWIPDISADPNFPRASVAGAAGLHAAFAAPIFSGRSVAGVFEFFTGDVHAPDADLLDIFAGIGSQIGQFIERKHAEMELADRETRMRAVLENAAEAIITIDGKGIIESANRGAEKMFGHPVAGMTGRNVSMLMPAPYSREHDGYLANYFRTGQAKVIGTGREASGLHRDGTVFPIELSVSEIRIEGKRLFTGFIRDITHRRQAEQALRGSQERLRLALEAARIGDWELDMVTKTARRSLRHDQIFGYAELLPEWTYPMFLDHVHPEDRARVDKDFQESVAAGRDWYFECRITRADKAERWIWARGSVIRDSSGQPANMVGMIADITERKQDEEKLRQLTTEAVERAAQLETANKELEAFSYSVSHDLRAPLRHVLGYVELLKKAAGDALPEKARGHLAVIADASRQMGQLIDDLLMFSRIGRSELHRDTVNLGDLVQLCRQALELETGNRRIVWKIGPLPAVTGDRAMLKQVFANLLGNAVKYTAPRDPAEIEIGVAGLENDRVILFIKDNGVGFDMQFKDRLFGVFQRLHTSEEFEGTGIGLANVRRIITRHGGRIWPEAAVDRGATFFFTLEQAPFPGHAEPAV